MLIAPLIINTDFLVKKVFNQEKPNNLTLIMCKGCKQVSVEGSNRFGWKKGQAYRLE
jgi:hypothetical protein